MEFFDLVVYVVMNFEFKWEMMLSIFLINFEGVGVGDNFVILIVGYILYNDFVVGFDCFFIKFCFF